MSPSADPVFAPEDDSNLEPGTLAFPVVGIGASAGGLAATKPFHIDAFVDALKRLGIPARRPA